MARLTAQIAGREGVEIVHVVAGADGGTAQLCIHYVPEALPLPRIRGLVEAAGARISERYGHALWRLDIPHERRACSIADRLRTLDGVIEAEASASGAVRVEFGHFRGGAGGRTRKTLSTHVRDAGKRPRGGCACRS